jgi:hypothetical protein
MRQEFNWLFKIDFNWMFHSWKKIDVVLFGFVKENGHNYNDYYFTCFGFGFGVRHVVISRFVSEVQPVDRETSSNAGQTESEKKEKEREKKKANDEKYMSKEEVAKVILEAANKKT